MREMTLKQFAQELDRLQKEGLKALEKGVNTIAEDLLSVSQKLAPLKEGGLMESGNVEPARIQGNEVSAKVGYNKEYAKKRHEDFYNLGETSSKKPSIDGMRVGRKFLAQPLTVYSDKYIKHLFDELLRSASK